MEEDRTEEDTMEEDRTEEDRTEETGTSENGQYGMPQPQMAQPPIEPPNRQGQGQGRYSSADGASESAEVLPAPALETLPNKLGIRAKDPEFIVAVIVFSILGGTLVLAALVLFGIHYMTTFILGMCMYAFALAIILVSELAVCRKLPKFSLMLTSLGIGGVYVATFVNSGRISRSPVTVNQANIAAFTESSSFTLNNFSSGAGVWIAVAFTLLVLLYSWKRQVGLYRVVGLLLCYFCIQPGFTKDATSIEPSYVQIEFLVLGALILILNLIHAILPVKRYTTAAFAPPMAALAIHAGLFFQQFFRQGAENYDLAGAVPGLVYLACVLFVVHLYLYKQMEAVPRERKGKGWEKTIIIIAYVFSLVEIFHQITYLTGASLGDALEIYSNESLCRNNLPALHFTMLSFGAMGLICFMMLYRHWEKWILYYFGSILFYQVYLGVRDGQYPGSIADIWCLLGLLILAKVLSLGKVKAVRAADAILTFLVCGNVLMHFDEWYSYMLMAVLVLSLLAVNHWHAYYELLVTYTLAFFVIMELPVMLKPPVFVGVLFVGALLVNHVKWMRGPYPLIYNIVILTGQTLSYFALLGHWYRNSYLTHFCMLVLGLSIITLLLQEKYQMNCGHKLLIGELFLTYMTLAVRLPHSFVTSILLMAIAVLAGVAGGFLADQKSARICGLVFSILVCGKIVLYDFSGGPVLQRVFLFLAVGVLALVIAGIYIILEKRTQEKHASQVTGGGK